MAVVYTIGVYGSDKEHFFAAIARAGIDIFLDVRRRRGVRGPLYPFANAKRLTGELESLQIPYRHILALAPENETRAIQYAADDRAKERKSERRQLAPEYVRAYVPQTLDRFDFNELARELKEFHAPLLCCVERYPEACHRSLVALRLARAMNASEIVHLYP
ncbi:MAG: DUF488 family protein [Candidatus Baltobacteraceae bacterium]